MTYLTDQFTSRFFEAVVHRSVYAILAVLLCFAILAAGLQHFSTAGVGIRTQFHENDPHLIRLDTFETTYAVSDSALVVLEPPGDSIFTREALAAVEQLTDALWQTPYVLRVDSLTNYLHIEGTEEGLIVEPLVDDAASLNDAMVDEVRSIALTGWNTAGRLVSRDGRLAGLIVSLAVPEEGREQAETEIVETLYGLIDAQGAANPEFAYYAYGEILLAHNVRIALDADTSVLAPIAFATMMLVAVLVLRSFWGVVGILFMLIAVLASGFGFAGWSGLKFYATSGAAIFVLMAIAIAHSVHLIHGVINGMREGMDRKSATIHSLRTNARPIFLTSLTTAIGFLSLNFSEMPPFRVMGNIVAFGSMIAFAYSVTLLPALISLMPMRAPRKAVVKTAGKTEFSKRLGTFVISHNVKLLWIFAALAVVSAFGIARIELDDNNAQILDDSYQIRQSADFIDENFSGLDALEYSLGSGQENGIVDVEYMSRVERFANWLRQQPEVNHVSSVTDILKQLDMALSAEADGSGRIPENSDLIAQYLLLYELSLPVGLDLNNLISFDRSASRLTVAIEGLTARKQIEFDKRASTWLRENAPEIQTSATGVIMVSAYAVIRNITNMLFGTMAAMFVVSLILVFVFRSVRLGLLSLIPNFLPAIISMAVWGYAVGTVSVAASIVTAIAFGIVVDDTIHLMTKYLRSRAEGKSPSDSVVPTFRLVGRPLLTTTLIFALGFLVFGASGFTANQTLGLLVALTVVIALMADFLLFPPLLLALDRGRGRAGRKMG
ncbi:MAG: MMPL family transporter [Rhodobacteraceae bacterium]|nr:MMPL family transporter [Paracoccaceae bacterium]